jgi:hypothetical protein
MKPKLTDVSKSTQWKPGLSGFHCVGLLISVI